MKSITLGKANLGAALAAVAIAMAPGAAQAQLLGGGGGGLGGSLGGALGGSFGGGIGSVGSTLDGMGSAAGLPAGRLTAVGYGSTQPVAANDTDQGKAQNRRIDFVVR